jgi:hypothetical protein
MEEMRHLLGVGVQLKEQKVIDRRPKKAEAATAKTVTATGVRSSLAPSEVEQAEARGPSVTTHQTTS